MQPRDLLVELPGEQINLLLELALVEPSSRSLCNLICARAWFVRDIDITKLG
jgi:hypothetical protein